ncbi:MAG: alpha/beta hydrolase [bacterium]|nr:alpha/beta hydrolase [bacterium]
MTLKEFKNNIFYHASAKQNRESLVLLHGLGGTGYAFKRLFLALEKKDVSFIAPDHPSHGKTIESDFVKYVEFILNLLTERRSERFIIISHSFGAVYAELLFERAKERIDQIMLVTPLLEARKQTKGMGLFTYDHPFLFDVAGNLMSVLPQRWRYPDYCRLGKKPYPFYWMSDMTHCNIREYFRIQRFVSEKRMTNIDFMSFSRVHLGKSDTITYADLTEKLVRGCAQKVVVHEGDHLYPLKEHRIFEDEVFSILKEKKYV